MFMNSMQRHQPDRGFDVLPLCSYILSQNVEKIFSSKSSVVLVRQSYPELVEGRVGGIFWTVISDNAVFRLVIT